MSISHWFKAVRDCGRKKVLWGRIKDKDPEIRRNAVEMLMQFDPQEIFPPLLAALDDESPDVRHEAVCVFRKIGGEIVVDPLISALRDQDSSVREAAAAALGGLANERATKYLIGLLEDDDTVTRLLASTGLSHSTDSVVILPLVTRALLDKDDGVRNAAIGSLKIIGDEQTAELFGAALITAKDKNVREAAVKALGVIQGERSVEFLIFALNDEDIEIEMEAYDALKSINRGAWRVFLEVIRSRKGAVDNCSHSTKVILSNGEYCVRCGECLRVG